MDKRLKLKLSTFLCGLVIVFSVGCKQQVAKPKVSELNQLMDAWHRAAADSDLEEYFTLMDSSFIYLGTDISERWTKESFLEFSEPYFKKKKTWNFKATSRNWYFNQNTAWFEENLDTWMGPIRASGVLIYNNNSWKLAHYNLTLTADNDKIKSYLEINNPVN